MNKICRKCEILKDDDFFHKDATKKDGLMGCCKTCHLAYKKKYSRSLYGNLKQMYKQQTASSKKRGHPKPAYTFAELANWMLQQPNFYELRMDYVNSGYLKALAPSVNRINPMKPYKFDNIELTTWAENKRLGYLDSKTGRDTKKLKSVVQLDDFGNVINDFHSMREAARQTNVSQGSISQACITGYRAGGYYWKLA